MKIAQRGSGWWKLSYQLSEPTLELRMKIRRIIGVNDVKRTRMRQ